jgi:hypothetical protein
MSRIYESSALLATAMNGNQVQNAINFRQPTAAYPQPTLNWPGTQPMGWSSQNAWSPSFDRANYPRGWYAPGVGRGLGRLGTISATVAALPTWQKVGGVVLGLWVLRGLLK